MSENQIIINNLSKVYNNGFEALKTISLDIKKGDYILHESLKENK